MTGGAGPSKLGPARCRSESVGAGWCRPGPVWAAWCRCRGETARNAVFLLFEELICDSFDLTENEKWKEKCSNYLPKRSSYEMNGKLMHTISAVKYLSFFIWKIDNILIVFHHNLLTIRRNGMKIRT